MTELLEKLKNTASPHERAQLQTFHIQMEQMRLAKQQNEAPTDVQAEVTTQPAQTGLKHYSPSPTLFAYGKAAAYANAGVKNASTLKAVVTNVEQPKKKDDLSASQTVYNQKFQPNSDHIYAPQVEQQHIVSYNKSNIGQTSVIPSMGKSNETLYRESFLKTQHQHDFSDEHNKANDGLEPVTAAYLVKDGDREFAKSHTGKLIDPTKVSGLIIKEVKREATAVDVKQQYLEQFKRAHKEQAAGVRPFAGGSVFARHITQDDWEEQPEGVRQLAMDNRTTNRGFHAKASEDAHEMSKRDREIAQERSKRDRSGDNPVTGAKTMELKTTNNVFHADLLKVNEEKKTQCFDNLKNDAKDAAKKLYGASEEEAEKFVSAMGEKEQKQMVFLAQEAERRDKEKWAEM